jgi:xanthine dehydrogenase accessory factor
MTTGDDPATLLHRVVDAMEDGEAVVVATVVDTLRTAPCRAGTKMLVYPDGRVAGSIGGGPVEARVIAEAGEALAEGHGRLLHYDLRELGMCGGEMTVYLEPQVPPEDVLVIGCGHVGRAVVELAHWLGFRVTALDDRPELVTEELLPDADALVAGPLAETLAALPPTAVTHVVLATRATEVDLEVLPFLLAGSARSIGVLGSRTRWQETRAALLELGVAEDDLTRVRTPIGLDLPAETPREIALAIVGELITQRRR